MSVRDHALISVDDHLIEPPHLWQSRVPRHLRDAAPKVVETGDGAEAWAFEGNLIPQIGLNAVAGKDPTEFRADPITFTDMIPGCYDPKARVADMDRAHIARQLCFPSFPRFAGQRFVLADDKDLALECVRAYNDFIVEEWCAVAPERFIPMAILPFWDDALSIGEIQRVASMGVRAVSLSEDPGPMGLPSYFDPWWEPILGAIADHDLAICMHAGSSSRWTFDRSDVPATVATSLMGTNSMATLVSLLFSPIFLRHPTLRVVLSEGGVGWMPYMLERMDACFRQHLFHADASFDGDMNRTTLPSELFAQNIWGCFIDDPAGIANRHRIGVDKIMWECDYPHSDSTWPDNVQVLEQQLAGVPEDEVAQILELNARRVFRLGD